MTRINLASLARTASRIPSVIVGFDESLSLESVASYLGDWPGPIEYWSRTQTSNYFIGQNENKIAEFCLADIFGFKLAAALRAANISRVIYADADVIWFHDICKLVSLHADSPIVGSSDLGRSYDQYVASLLPSEVKRQLETNTGVCAGFFLVNSPLMRNVLVQQIISALNLVNVSRFSEQTIVASLAHSLGDIFDSKSVMMISRDYAKLFSPHLRSVPFACHYPDGERPQFWIDRLRK